MRESDKRVLTDQQATSSPDRAESLGQDTALQLTIQRDVLSLATRMAEALNITIPDDRWPTVAVSDTAPTSKYSLGDNSITIASRHLNDGFTYAEEITHFLKTILSPPTTDQVDTSDEMVDYKTLHELCGRLGRNFAHRICEGTELEHLFKKPSEGDGERLKKSVSEAEDRFDRTATESDRLIHEFRNSAACFGQLESELEKIIDDEWKGNTVECPQATALLKRRIPEILESPSTPAIAITRLRQIGDFIETPATLSAHDTSRVLDALRTCGGADNDRAIQLTLQTGLASLTILDMDIHAQAYTAAEDFMRAHPDTWLHDFKTIMRLSVADLRNLGGIKDP